MNDQSFVAVNDAIPAAGRIVYWRLAGSLRVDALAAAWSAAGLEQRLLPETPTPSVALRRAVQEAARRRKRIVWPAPAGGYALLEKEAADGDDPIKLAETCRARLNMAGRVKVEPFDHSLAPTIREAFDAALESVEQDDLRPWMIRQVRRLDGVALRPDGGVYFVPRHRLAEWDAIARAVEGASESRVFGIPALPGSEVVDAVLDAVEQEARAESEALLTEVLADSGELVVGSRAIRNRRDAVADIGAKLGRYEALLGAKLDGLRARLEETRAALVAFELQAMNAEEAKERQAS